MYNVKKYTYMYNDNAKFMIKKHSKIKIKFEYKYLLIPINRGSPSLFQQHLLTQL